MENNCAKTIADWDKNAATWDEAMQEGSPFQKRIVEPHTLQFLNIQPNQTVLDFACGNGQMSRVLARLGAKVTAIDISQEMIKHARLRSQNLEIDYRVADITHDKLENLGTSKFDAFLCNMALMDIEDIKPVFQLAYKVLKDSGVFVFSINHPCYDKSAAVHVRENSDQDGILVTQTCLKVREYLQSTVQRVRALPTLPAVHYFYHRPLQFYLNAAFSEGFSMSGVAEVGFSEDTNLREHRGWHELPQIPVVIIAKLIK
jgi:2-polyprenyl-3-methyl-5-hydroxy-6-metoxy-1,4-benzoquinol methylase